METSLFLNRCLSITCHYTCQAGQGFRIFFKGILFKIKNIKAESERYSLLDICTLLTKDEDKDSIFLYLSLSYSLNSLPRVEDF